MNVILCVRVYNSGPYQQFDNPDDAIDYLNEHQVGQVDAWVSGMQAFIDNGLTHGFTTCNHTGQEYVRIYWGDSANNYRGPLDTNDRFYIEHKLEEHVTVPAAPLDANDQSYIEHGLEEHVAIPASTELSPDYAYLWLRVGDSGEYEKMDDLDAAIEYLNELNVGKVTAWVYDGFETQNYHGRDYIRLYYGDHERNHLADIGEDEDEEQEQHRQYVECNLERSEL